MAEPIVFLDVDGLLNHRGAFLPSIGPDPLCPKAIDRSLRLIADTGTQVVLSSTWRLSGPDTKHMQKLRNAGVMNSAHKDWRTIDLPSTFQSGVIIDHGPRRGREIADWLSRHPEHGNFAIIDDDSDMLPEQMPRFVQTSFDTGLLDEHCDKVRVILNT